VLAGCAAAPPAPRLVEPAALAARDRLEQQWQDFKDLRSLTEIQIRRDDRVQRLAGVLLLRSPSSLRFEALSPFGTPVLIVAADAQSLTLWEVLDDRAFVLPASPDANRRWLGLALGGDELVATLSGRVLPLRDPLEIELLPADGTGPSLRLTGSDRTQRIWFDPTDGEARAVEWTGTASPVRAIFVADGPHSPPASVNLLTLDGKLGVSVKYRNPRLNTGFDPGLLNLTVPEHVRIQEFR
jgi:outer membrane lipoprotein-sorting protein